MSVGEYLEGDAFLAVTLGGTGVAAALMTRRYAGQLVRAELVAGVGVAWLGSIFVVPIATFRRELLIALRGSARFQ